MTITKQTVVDRITAEKIPALKVGKPA